MVIWETGLDSLNSDLKITVR